MVHCHGFVMVRDVSLSWFRHGSSWFTVMVCHGSLSWFVMIHCHGSSWFVMVHCHGSSWFTVMVSSWFVMVRDVLFSKILQKRSCDPLQPIRVSNSLSNLIFDETSYFPLSI